THGDTSIYARYYIDGKNTSIHRLILGAKCGKYVDHINGDTLNNSRQNLRLCSQLENSRNRRKQFGSSSSFKGVTWNKLNKKWQAQIKNGHNIYLGLFKSEIAASTAYNKKAIEIFGRFARLNQV